jgi:hypothetical protein
VEFIKDQDQTMMKFPEASVASLLISLSLSLSPAFPPFDVAEIELFVEVVVKLGLLVGGAPRRRIPERFVLSS